MSGAGGSGATGATMTALNIFMKMCREEHQEMFPEEQLGTLITSLHLLHSFRFKVGGYGDKKGLCCEAQARVRQGSARDGPQGKRPQSLNPCLELTLKLVATFPPTFPPTTTHPDI